MKVTLTTVQMYCRDDHSMIVTTQYDVDHKQHTNTQQMMLYSFQVYKKNNLHYARKVVVSWCENYLY